MHTSLTCRSGSTPLIRNLGTTWRLMVSFRLDSLNPGGGTPVTQRTERGGSQSWKKTVTKRKTFVCAPAWNRIPFLDRSARSLVILQTHRFRLFPPLPVLNY